MKTKIAMLLVVFYFTTSTIYGQKFGLKAGVLYSDIILETPGFPYETLHPESTFGFFAGGTFKKSFNNLIGMEANLLFIQQGAKEFISADINRSRVTYNYLALPVLFNIRAIKKMSIDAGFKTAYWLSSNFFESGIEKIDFALVGGLSYLFTDKCQLSIRYNHSLNNLRSLSYTDTSGVNAGEFNYVHRNIQLGYGYYF